MKISNIETIFFVAGLTSCRDFYKSLFQIEPLTDEPGMVEFELAPNAKLGLMPIDGISRIVGVDTIKSYLKDIPPRSELYLMVENLDEIYSRAMSIGAIPLSPIQNRNWGHRVGYVADIEGNILAFAKQIL